MAKVHSLRAWGTHLVRLRQNAGLSGAKVVNGLAALGIQIDRRTVYAYEAGRIAAPDAGVLWGLAQIYRVSADELVAALVSYRTGRPSTVLEPRSSDEMIRVTSTERDLIQDFRSLSAKDRHACGEFIKFEKWRSRH